jgi:hypothetical protein
MAGKILALTARSEAGKDYLASHLVKIHGYVRVSFSDELKRIAKSLFHWVELDYLPEDKNKVINHPDNVNQLTARDVWKGIDFLRHTDPQIFVRGAKAKAKKLIHEGTNVVFTDVRKPIELDTVNSMDATVVHLREEDSTTYPDEDVIDNFDVDYTFTNVKYQGLRSWELFCSSAGIIDPAWINVIPQLVENQITENNAFNARVPNQPKPFMFRLAMMAEYGEFLEEVPHLWKWWKPFPATFDKNKATEEFVDVVKFAIGFWLQHATDAPIQRSEDVSAGVEIVQPTIINIERIDALIRFLNQDINTPADINRYITGIIHLIHVGCDVLDINVTQFVAAFNAKLELNVARVDSGYCATGDKTGLETVEQVRSGVIHIEDFNNSNSNISNQPIHDVTCFDNGYKELLPKNGEDVRLYPQPLGE